MEGLSPDPGRVEDTYDLGGELGRGAFSVVMRGKHRDTRDNVAIKIIDAHRFKSNQRAQEAIRAEVEAMKRIREYMQSSCLIIMRAVYCDPSKVCIVLEQLNGGELFDRIVDRGRYTERDASQVLGKLAVALGQCHEKGILHRDVKPENILYVSKDEHAEIKLTDFGLAMLEDGASINRKDENLVGTPGYVAPEVLSYRIYGPPCDVWACGVITYILLVGYPPFFPTADYTLFDVIKKGKYYFHPEAWDSISSEAKDLVHSMLTVDMDKRATTAQILQHPWVTQSGNLPEQHLTGTITRLKSFNAKRKWRAVAAVVMMGARWGLKKRHREEQHHVGDAEECDEFTEADIGTLRSAFFSSAEGGVLDREHLASLLSDIGFGPVPSDRMFDLFDKDGNGEVDYSEFLAGMTSFKQTGDKALQFCFDVYDRDGVGAINLDQLKSVLSCVMATRATSTADGGQDEVNSEDKLSEMFQDLDVDGNGVIDFGEFKAGAKREPLLVEAFLAPVRQGSLATAPAARRRSSLLGSGASAETEDVSTHTTSTGSTPVSTPMETRRKSDAAAPCGQRRPSGVAPASEPEKTDPIAARIASVRDHAERAASGAASGDERSLSDAVRRCARKGFEGERTHEETNAREHENAKDGVRQSGGAEKRSRREEEGGTRVERTPSAEEPR